MTEPGWAEFAPNAAGRARDSWKASVEAGERAQCAAPQVSIPPYAPATEDAVIVQVTTTRRVSTASGAVYTEELAQQRYALRGVDALWRIDVTASGG